MPKLAISDNSSSSSNGTTQKEPCLWCVVRETNLHEGQILLETRKVRSGVLGISDRSHLCECCRWDEMGVMMVRNQTTSLTEQVFILAALVLCCVLLSARSVGHAGRDGSTQK